MSILELLRWTKTSFRSSSPARGLLHLYFGGDEVHEPDGSTDSNQDQSSSPNTGHVIAGYIVWVNREGTIEYVAQWEGGISYEGLLGNSVFDRVPPDAREILIARLQDVFSTHVNETIIMPAPADCDKGGMVEIKLIPLKYPGKPIDKVAVAFRRTAGEIKLPSPERTSRLQQKGTRFPSRMTFDELPCETSLKKQKHIEALLKEAEENFRRLADTSLQGIIIIQDDTIVFTNQRAADVIGITVAELTGLTMVTISERFIEPESRALLDQKRRDLFDGVVYGSSYELRIRTMSGDARWLDVTTMPVTYRGHDAIQASLIDVTDRKKTEDDLRDSEERYRTLVENAQNAIFSMEYDGTLAFLNSVAARMLGGEPSEYVGKNVRDLFPPDKAERHLAAVQRVIDNGKGETIENLTELRGQPRWHITSIHPLNGRNGKRHCAFLISTDITDSKLASQKLARERDFTRSILQTANSLIICLDERAEILIFNEECERVTGYSGDEVRGKRWSDIFVPPEYRHEGLKDFGTWVREHPHDRKEEPIITKSGERRCILWSNSSFISPDTGELAAIAIGYDITEVKRANQQLKEAEARYRNLVELLPQIAYTAALNGNSTTTYISPQVEKILGFSPAEYLTNPDLWYQQLYPDDRERVLAELRRTHETGRPLNIEYRMYSRDRRVIWFRDHAVIIRDSDGTPLFLQGVQYDITENKVAEDALRESEKRFKDLADMLPSTVFELSLKGKFTFVNSHGLDLFGYTLEELSHDAAVFDVLSPADRDRVKKSLLEILGGRTLQGAEYTAVRKDGSAFPALIHVNRISHNGKISGFRGILVDITQRKKVEELLRQSQEAYRDLVENVDDVLYILDQDLVITYVSPIVKSVLGYEPAELLGQTALSLVHPDDLPGLLVSVNDVLNNRLYPSDYRMLTKTGDIRWVQTSSRPIFEKDKLIGVRGILTDITERKRSERALRESQERFERVAQQSREMVWEVDADGLYTYVSQACDEILGYRPDELTGKMHFYDLQPESEREDFRKNAFANQIVPRAPFHNQVNKVVSKTGRVLWFLTSGSPVLDADGNLKGFVGADLDITERIEMEQDLHIKERALASSINGLGLADLQGRISYVNDAFVKMWGYTREEIYATPMSNLAFDPQDVVRVMDAIRSKGQFFGESVSKRKDGTPFDVQISASMVTNASNQPIAMLATFIDITERKRSERALQMSEERFRLLYKGNPLPTYTWQRRNGDFFLVECNSAAVTMTNGKIASYIGVNAKELFVKRPDVFDDLNLCLDERSNFNREMEYQLGSPGRTVLFSVRYNFVPPDLVLVQTEDITQRKHAESALKMSEERFRALFKGSPLPMVLFQWRMGDLVLIDTNDATNSVTEGKLAQLTGETAKHIFQTDQEFLNELYECFSHQSTISREVRHQFWGTDHELRLSVFCSFVPPDLMLIQAEDITERKRMEERLLSAKLQLERDSQALKEKNITLKEVLTQIQDEVDQVKQNIQSNISKLVIPVLLRLREKARESDRIELEHLESVLSNAASPFIRDIESRFVQLTPRETEICNMICNGLQSKEIGQALGISHRTVEKFRQKIRAKLGVKDRDTNLTSFIRSLSQKP